MFGKLGRILSLVLALVMAFSFCACAEEVRVDVKLDSVYGAFNGAVTIGHDDVHKCAQILIESDFMEDIFAQVGENKAVFGNKENGYTEIGPEVLMAAMEMVYQAYSYDVSLDKAVELFDYFKSEKYLEDQTWIDGLLTEEMNRISYLAMNMGMITMHENGDMEINISLDGINDLAAEYLPMVLEDKQTMDGIRALGICEIFKDELEAEIERLEKVAYHGESLFAETNTEDFKVYAKVDARGFLTADMYAKMTEPACEMRLSVYADISGLGMLLEYTDADGSWSYEQTMISNEKEEMKFVKNGAEGDTIEIYNVIEGEKSELLLNVKNEKTIGNVRVYSDMVSDSLSAEFTGNGSRITYNYEENYFPYKENLDILWQQDGNDMFVCKLKNVDGEEHEYEISAAWDQENKYVLNMVVGFEEDYSAMVIEGTLEKNAGEIKYTRTFSAGRDHDEDTAYVKYASNGINYKDEFVLDIKNVSRKPSGTVSYMSEYTGYEFKEYIIPGITGAGIEVYHIPGTKNVECAFAMNSDKTLAEVTLDWTGEGILGGKDVKTKFTASGKNGKSEIYLYDNTSINGEIFATSERDGNILKVHETAYEITDDGSDPVLAMEIDFEYNLKDDTYSFAYSNPQMNMKYAGKYDGETVTETITDYDGNEMVSATVKRTIDENGVSVDAKVSAADAYTVFEELGAVKTGENEYLAYFRYALDLSPELYKFAQAMNTSFGAKIPVTINETENGMEITASLSVETDGEQADMGTVTVGITQNNDFIAHVSGEPMEAAELAEILYGYLMMIAE